MVLDCSIDWGSGRYYVLSEFHCADTNRKPHAEYHTCDKLF